MYVAQCSYSWIPANKCKAGHGGTIDGPKDKTGKKTKAQPFVFHCAKSDGNWGEVAAGAWKTVGDRRNIPPFYDHFICFHLLTHRLDQQFPQIIMYILPDKGAVTYERLKRNMECRFGIVSQSR